jgi:hypothetical protein
MDAKLHGKFASGAGSRELAAFKVENSLILRILNPYN